MSFFGNKSTSKTYGALVDIGSGSVGVGIVESDRSQAMPRLIYSHRELMRINKKDTDREARVRQMREAFFSASLALSTDGLQQLHAYNSHAKISRILITCASPWAHTVSRKVSYQSDENVKVTSALIENLESDAEEKAEEELQQSAVVGKLGLHVVERATVNARINGYDVHDPEGLEGTDIELSHIIGLIPEEIMETIYEVQEKILVDTKLSAHTFMLVNYCIIRDVLTETDTLAILDVTGESTEIGIVENGVLTETRHTPYGSHTLLRDIAKTSGSSAEHALTLLRGYTEGTLSNEDEERVSKLIQPFIDALKDMFVKLHKTRNMPTTLTITALPELEDFFKKTIPVAARSINDVQYNIYDTTKEAIKEMELDDDSDTFIALSSRFFHKLHGCGEIEDV